jgi:hypothetical protein
MPLTSISCVAGQQPDCGAGLLSIYVRPGRDNGPALWWVAKSHVASALQRQCIPKAAPERDQDRFNAGLEALPPETFKGVCPRR